MRLTEGVEVAIYLYETGNHEYKVSLRSKELVDVSEIASPLTDGPVLCAAVAKVGDDEYKTLAEAIEAAKNGATVELLRDVYVETWNQAWNTKGMTIEGKGKTITIGKVESNVNGNYLFYNADNLKVNDLSIKFQTNGNGFDMVSGELNKVAVDQTVPASADAHALYPMAYRRTHHSPDRRIHARSIAAAG